MLRPRVFLLTVLAPTIRTKATTALNRPSAVAREKSAVVAGEFGCRGFDTFGPFGKIGGIAKGRPNEKDLERARAFARKVSAR